MPSTLVVGEVIYTNELNNYSAGKNPVGGKSGKNSEGSRGVVQAGFFPATMDVIDYHAIGTSGNSADFGNLVASYYA